MAITDPRFSKLGQINLGGMSLNMGSNGGVRSTQPAPTGTSSTSTSKAPELPPLRAYQLQDLNTRRRDAARSVEDALRRRAQLGGQIRERQTLNLSDLNDTFAGKRQGMMAELGGKGLAFQPRFAGQGQKGLRDEKARKVASVRSGAAQKLASLDQMVAAARSQRDTEIDQIGRDKVAMRTDLAELLKSIGA